MKRIENLRKYLLSLPETTEEPHFEKTSFRVAKKIFATYDSSRELLCVKLGLIDQDVFCKTGEGNIYPVDNKWGKQGWTLVQISHVKDERLTDVVTTAYCEVAPQKFAILVRPAGAKDGD